MGYDAKEVGERLFQAERDLQRKHEVAWHQIIPKRLWRLQDSDLHPQALEFPASTLQATVLPAKKTATKVKKERVAVKAPVRKRRRSSVDDEVHADGTKKTDAAGGETDAGKEAGKKTRKRGNA